MLTKAQEKRIQEIIRQVHEFRQAESLAQVEQAIIDWRDGALPISKVDDVIRLHMQKATRFFSRYANTPASALDATPILDEAIDLGLIGDAEYNQLAFRPLPPSQRVVRPPAPRPVPAPRPPAQSQPARPVGDRVRVVAPTRDPALEAGPVTANLVQPAEIPAPAAPAAAATPPAPAPAPRPAAPTPAPASRRERPERPDQPRDRRPPMRRLGRDDRPRDFRRRKPSGGPGSGGPPRDFRGKRDFRPGKPGPGADGPPRDFRPGTP